MTQDMEPNYARMYAHGTYKRSPWFHKWTLGVAQRLVPLLPKGNLLDIGCGPGHVTHWLHNQGYSTVGIDSNQHMIAEAKKLYQGTWFHDDLLEYYTCINKWIRNQSKFDSAICLGDIVNSVTEDKCFSFFHAINKVLNPGGVLAFDLNTLIGMESWNEVQVQDREDYFKIDRGTFSPKTGIASISITGFFRPSNDDPSFLRFQENVTNYYRVPTTVIRILVAAGFNEIQIYDEWLQNPIQDKIDDQQSSKLILIAKKPSVLPT